MQFPECTATVITLEVNLPTFHKRWCTCTHTPCMLSYVVIDISLPLFFFKKKKKKNEFDSIEGTIYNYPV